MIYYQLNSKMFIQTVFKIFLWGVVFLGPNIAFSKEMPQRLGVGIKNNTSESVPSIAAIYHLNDVSAFTSGLGFDTEKDNSKFQINAGLRHVIFHEKQLHFYTGGQLALVSYEALDKDLKPKKDSGFEAHLILGAEFFFDGLENLGFSFEGGLGLSSVRDTRVRTLGLSPLQAGIIFYF